MLYRRTYTTTLYFTELVKQFPEILQNSTRMHTHTHKHTRTHTHTHAHMHTHTHTDLTRMYSLVNRVPQGMAELRSKFDIHVHAQGLTAVEKCGAAVLNVRALLIIILSLSTVKPGSQ